MEQFDDSWSITIDNIKDIQARILNIAVVMHKILTANKIPYYMIGGTMLGAIRHKGFIPWDDDMDFGIPREFFDEAIRVLKKELQKPYHVVKSNSGLILTDYAKIEDSSTCIVEKGRDKSNETIGLFVDLFPLDITENNNFGVFSRNRWIREFLKMNNYQFIWPNRFFDKILTPFVRLLPRDFFKRLALTIAYKTDLYRVNYAGAYREREIINSRIWGTPTLYPFENVSLFGPEDFDSFLKCVYNDYMKLPPEKNRSSHIIKCYIKKK